MTTMLSSRGDPSPSKRNPFARATVDQVVARRRLLPTVVSSRVEPADPAFAEGGEGQNADVLSKGTPAKAAEPASTPAKDQSATPATKAKTAWRMLWRGGLEVGPDGWRLDGASLGGGC